MKIVTHSGHFHADELLGVATLLLKYPDAGVVRSRDEKEIASADIVLDVGHIYDPAILRFDHHQTEGAGVRENGIPYASFGLVWKEYGKEVAGGVEEARIIEEKLVMPVDALDNGINLSASLFKGTTEYTIGDYFESFAEGADGMEEQDAAFRKALPIATDFIKRQIASAQRTASDWREVKRFYDESENKKIVILPGHFHWKRILIPTEALYVVFPRLDASWAAQAVPREANSFEVKKPFPKSWSGLSNGEMIATSGVSDAFFCHRDCYLANAKSQEGALKLAQIALNS